MDGVIFGKNLRIIRQNKGLSQRGLSEMSGVNLSTIVKYESGNAKRPDMRIAQSLASFFNVPIDYFERDDNASRFMIVDDDYPIVSQCWNIMEKAKFHYEYIEKLKESLQSGDLSKEEADRIKEQVRKKEEVLNDFEKLLIETSDMLSIDDDDERNDYYDKMAAISDYYGNLKKKRAELSQSDKNTRLYSVGQETVDISYHAFVNTVRKITYNGTP